MFLARTGGNIVYGGLGKSAFVSEFSLSLKSGFCTKIWGSSRNPPYTPDVSTNINRHAELTDTQTQKEVNDKKSNIKTTKAQANRLFDQGYELAFLTNKKLKPWDKIFDLWKTAAMAGHTRAQFYLGTCYDFGNGVDKDLSEAFNWYLKAAEKGKMEAQYNIGFFYKEGELVKQDYKKAVHWYSLAAEQGDTEAQRDLGYCYFYGEGVKQDALKAVYWYKKAAKKNDDKSLYNLGLCYEFGDGVNKSIRWAKHYYQKASKLGHRKATNKLKKI